MDNDHNTHGSHGDNPIIKLTLSLRWDFVD